MAKIIAFDSKNDGSCDGCHKGKQEMSYATPEGEVIGRICASCAADYIEQGYGYRHPANPFRVVANT